jgi:hypothetical protein
LVKVDCLYNSDTSSRQLIVCLTKTIPI